ncbi:unnamed protein product [Heterobilharzia americana]|nr:unnamed protein product [Heterobilharzia americana]
MHWIQNYDRNRLAGFRKYKSYADQIETLRIILEQSIEWQSTLHLNFIDFEKVFDRVDREVIWKLLQHHGIPQTFINLIQQLYEEATCQVIHNGKLSDAFEVKTGVKQGYLLSPMIYLIVVDCGMQRTVGSEKREIRWTAEKNLEDLDFANDLCLMSHKLEDLQAKTNKLAEEAAKTALQVNVGKTGDEDTQATTTATTNSNHHEREKLKGSNLLHLSRKHCFNYRRHRHR